MNYQTSLSQWPSLDSGNFFGTFNKNNKSNDTTRDTNVSGLAGGGTGRVSRLKVCAEPRHFALPGSQLLCGERTYQPWYLVLGFGGSISTKSYIFLRSFNKILQYVSQHIEKTNGKKTQSIKANGSLQEPFSQSRLRVNDDSLLFLAIAIGHIRHAVHLSKTCCGSTLTQISASKCPESTLLKECCLIASCTFEICLFDCFWTWLNPGSSQYNIT